MVIMTSTDGFCSTIIFEPGELGEIHPGPAPSALHPTSLSRPSSSTMSNQPFSAPARGSSPTRSNSSSSVVTLSGFVSAPKISPVPPVALSAPSPTSTFVQPTALVLTHTGANRNPSVPASGSTILGTPPNTPTEPPGIPQKREVDTPEPRVPTADAAPKSKKRRVAPSRISTAELQK